LAGAPSPFGEGPVFVVSSEDTLVVTNLFVTLPSRDE